ncbi:MAG TPA: hypothetical protein PKE69_07370 [Pyrinomonadaceae bacterium]|nr:hypothetical protein [Pyrinomonadaceae bacterium]
MRKLVVLLLVSAFLLGGCGGKTYSGMLKMQNGAEKTEGKVTVMVKQESEKVATVTISNSDSSNPTLLYRCSSLKFVKVESGDATPWMAMETPCTLFKENDSKFGGMLTFDDKKMRLSGTLTENGSRSYFHEFDGEAK